MPSVWTLSNLVAGLSGTQAVYFGPICKHSRRMKPPCQVGHRLGRINPSRLNATKFMRKATSKADHF